MSYQESFQTNIDEFKRGYYKFIVSRNFSSPRDAILEQYVPAEFPTEFVVEISMFSDIDNSLVYNAMYKNTTNDAFTVQTLQYSNREIRKLLFVNLADLMDNFPIGEFTVVMNFYVMEIGDVGAPSLEVKQISASGTELELTLTPSSNTPQMRQKLMEFARPRLTGDVVLEAIDQIFATGSVVQLQTDNTRYSSGSLLEQLPEELNQSAKEYVVDISNNIMKLAYQRVKTRITADKRNGKTIFTDAYLNNLITLSITQAYTEQMQQEEEAESSKIVNFVTPEDRL